MARRNRRATHRAPEVNLIPMLDVLMTVLTFFIIISMTLGVEQGVDVQLPSNAKSQPQSATTPDPLIAKLAKQGITVSDRPLTKPQLVQQVKAYLAQNPKGIVVLQAAPEVAYEQVVELLGELKDLGGDRISLAIE
jgi:biopolymer transport protein ExbD